MGIRTDRFSIAKDLKEWMEIDNISPWGDLSGSDELTWKYEYKGKSTFSQFMNVYSSEVESFQKYFPDMDIWLKNIYWDPLFQSAQKILDQVFSKVSSPESLVIIHASPLEIVIAGEFLKKNGLCNLTYNFNRVPAVNSISKTLEAVLFLVSWDKIDWIKSRIDSMEIQQKDLTTFQNTLFIFDENDVAPSWNISRIDPYVKSAIGWKENIVTYRLNELPEKELLLSEGIKNIYFFDTDASNSIDLYYRNTLGSAFKFLSYKINSSISDKIGYFEDYVCKKNEEYLIYKKDILSKNENISGTLTGGGGTEKWKKNYNSSSTQNSKGSAEPLSLKEGLVYLGGLSVILPLFLLLEVSGGQSVFTKNSSGSWIYNGGGSSSSFRSSSSSSWGTSFSKSASSSSSVSSFGGGGFSKGGG